jgi:hypothetical protein
MDSINSLVTLLRGLDSNAVTILVSILAVLLVVALTLVTTRMHVKSQERQWQSDRKESAYLEALRLLWQSRFITYDGMDGQSYLDLKDFLGRMQTLQYTQPWIIVAGNRSSAESEKRMETAVKNLVEKIDLVRNGRPYRTGEKDERGEDIKIMLDCGLSQAVEDLLEAVVESCKAEFGRKKSISSPRT